MRPKIIQIGNQTSDLYEKTGVMSIAFTKGAGTLTPGTGIPVEWEDGGTRQPPKPSGLLFWQEPQSQKVHIGVKSTIDMHDLRVICFLRCEK